MGDSFGSIVGNKSSDELLNRFLDELEGDF